VVPLYLLARSELPARAAWAAAAFWPLAAAANLFQPGADTAYPLLSTVALALAAWGARQLACGGRYPIGLALAVMSGLVLAFGMIFTLAFLPVGLIVALVLVVAPSLSLARRAALIVAVGAGFLSLTALGWILTGANPLIVWTWNLKNHARFYLEYPRTYLAWLAINPIELAIAMGLPSAAWSAVGLLSHRSAPRVAWISLGVLVVMNLVGRNMGEVARLWMLFVPPLLTAAGAGLDRLGGGPKHLAISAALTGLQTLALENLIQVVYPV
jgi:methylthioxylose transferase